LAFVIPLIERTYSYASSVKYLIVRIEKAENIMAITTDTKSPSGALTTHHVHAKVKRSVEVIAPEKGVSSYWFPKLYTSIAP
jgi:hypothetical protein